MNLKNEHSLYRPDIDGLRALAVLLVIGFHGFAQSLPGGFVGVDIFFVISGYLISGVILRTLKSENFTFSNFYIRRIKRLFPALSIVLIFTLLFGWFLLLDVEFKRLGKHAFGGAGFISNILYLLESTEYFDQPAKYKPLLHLWSLGVEEQFYFIFPILFYFSWKKRYNLLLFFSCFLLLSFSWTFWKNDNIHTENFYSPISRFWELLVGVVLCLWEDRGKIKKGNIRVFGRNEHTTNDLKIGIWKEGGPTVKRAEPTFESLEAYAPHLLSLTGLGLIFLTSKYLDSSLGYTEFWVMIPVLGAALIIAAGPESIVNRLVLSNRLSVFLGLISYPLYLWHWPIFFYSRMIWGSSIAVRFSSIAVAIFLSWLTYRFIEKPIRQSPRNADLKLRASFISVAAIGLSGILIHSNNGFPNRIANSINLAAPIWNRISNTNQAGLDYTKIDSVLPYAYCHFTNTGSNNTCAVIGDSHALCAYYGLAERLSDKKINTLLLGTSGFVPLIGAKNQLFTRQKNEKYQKYVLSMIDIIKNKKDIKTVIIFTRGPIYMFGAPNSWRKAIRLSPSNFRESLQKTVSELHASGKKVFVVSENPELPLEAEDLVPRPLLGTKIIPKLYKQDVVKRQESYLSILDGITDAVIIKNLDLFLADETYTLVSKEGNLFYYDDNHLSIAGSRVQAEYIDHFLGLNDDLNRSTDLAPQ